MSRSNPKFRNHLLSLRATELAKHKSLMPCVIFSSKSSLIISSEKQEISAKFICIKPNVSHRVSIRDGGAEILHLDGLQLPTTMPDFVELDETWSHIPESFQKIGASSITDFRNHLSERLHNIDPAVMEILEKLYTPSIARMSQDSLAKTLKLERTQALRHFKDNTGQTFRKYKIWAASMAAVVAVYNGEKIGTAAIDAGFSDASHAARTAKAIFGVTPTAGLQSLIRIKSD